MTSNKKGIAREHSSGVYAFVVFAVLACAALISSNPSHAAEVKKLRFVSESWEGYTNKDNTGLYFDLLNAALGSESYEMTLIPWKRAQKEFGAGKFDGLVGEDSTAKASYPRWPIDVNAFGALYDTKKLPTWNRAALKDLKVIWVRGYDVNKFATELKPFAEVQDMAQGVKMVMGGRADVFIDFQKDIESYAKKNKIKLTNHKVEKTDIPGGFTFVCFRKGDEGATLAKKFDASMDQLMKDGKLKPIYEKYQYGHYFDEIAKYMATGK